MKFISSIKRLVLYFSLGGGIILSSCTKDALVHDKGFSLHYPSVTNTAPGRNLSFSPTWYDGTPSDFRIVSVKLDGEPVQTACFVIDQTTGAFQMQDSQNLTFGKYDITISCNVNGQTLTFDNIISIEMMKPVPDGIVMEPAQLVISLGDIFETPQTGLPTSSVLTEGSASHVSIKSYAIENVYVDGELNNELKAWFNVSEEGVFSVNPDNPAFESGIYTFDFRLTTYFVDEDSQEGIFANALSLTVTSPPYSLEYAQKQKRVELGSSISSEEPRYKGSYDGLRFEVSSVLKNGEPSENIGITIDEKGVLTFPESSQVAVGDVFKVSVKAINDFGQQNFEDVYEFEVIEFIHPITEFAYNNVPRKLAGTAIENPYTEMNGTEVTFSFVDLPEALKGLRLDGQTGIVYNDKGNEFPDGEYTVTVRAENMKGHKDATFTLDIANFTYICWGNNLGEGGTMLDPREKYTNQFRITCGSESLTISFEDALHDIPEGYEYTISTYRPESIRPGISVDENGNLTLGQDTSDKYKNTSNILFCKVTVTITDGDDQLVRSIPVFVDRYNPEECDILYTPLVFRVNPKTGGTSDLKATEAGTGAEKKPYITEFSRYFYFYNLNGPESHFSDKRVNSGTTAHPFIYSLWQKYFDSVGGKVSVYKDDPVSYAVNSEAGTLDKALTYIDGTTGQVVVNPEKFKDANGVYADGVSMSTATSANQYRLFVWFDPNFNETAVTE